MSPAQEHAALLAEVREMVRGEAAHVVEQARQAQLRGLIEKRLREALWYLNAPLPSEPLQRQLAATVRMGAVRALIREAIALLGPTHSPAGEGKDRLPPRSELSSAGDVSPKDG